jgi:polyhydroxybutyrate depolymerase
VEDVTTVSRGHNGVMRRSLLLVAALVAALVLSACAGRHPDPVPTPVAYPVGTSVHTLEFDGEQREYRVYVPRTLADGPSALVVMMHGGFGSAEQAELSYGWDRQAEISRIVVAYPEGLGRSWNAGGCCGPAMKKNVDDVGFIEAMIAEIGTGLELDDRRIFATGMSNGGIMAYRLACETELFAAIAPVAGTMLVDCNPPHPVSVLHIHGGVDGSVPPDGSLGGGTQNIDGPPLEDVIAYWRTADGCGEPTVSQFGDDPRVQLEAAVDCDNATAVEFIVISDAGHQWPGSTTSDVQDQLGADPPSQLLDATFEIAGFFGEHPRS